MRVIPMDENNSTPWSQNAMIACWITDLITLKIVICLRQSTSLDVHFSDTPNPRRLKTRRIKGELLC